MTTRVERSIEVDQPIDVVYDQWTQFEEFPRFMGGVERVTQLDDTRLHWVAEILGVRRQWDATIVEQVPDQKIAWAATEGATNAGAVSFAPAGPGRTAIRVVLEFAPEGIVERIGEKLHVIERQTEADLERFKAFIEGEHAASGAWRGTVAADTTARTPGVEDAAASQGTSGKAGLSGAAKVVGAAVAAAGLAAVAKARSGSPGGAEELAEAADAPRDGGFDAPPLGTAAVGSVAPGARTTPAGAAADPLGAPAPATEFIGEPLVDLPEETPGATRAAPIDPLLAADDERRVEGGSPDVDPLR